MVKSSYILRRAKNVTKSSKIFDAIGNVIKILEISTFFCVSFSEYMNFARTQKRSQNVNVSLHRKSSIQNVKVGTCIDRIILCSYRYLVLTYTHTHSNCYLIMNWIEVPKSKTGSVFLFLIFFLALSCNSES